MLAESNVCVKRIKQFTGSIWSSDNECADVLMLGGVRRAGRRAVNRLLERLRRRARILAASPPDPIETRQSA